MLYTYVVRYDDGKAPNPYWGVCTLAICKPGIRRRARVGDWIVGTGSRHSPLGDVGTSVVYAMQVTDTMTMNEYDGYTKAYLPAKAPLASSSDPRRWVGDSIFDFGKPGVPIRPGSPHGEKDRARDLGGEYVLLSDRFIYFGDQPRRLPDDLLPIVKGGQGHRSQANEPYLGRFVEWLIALNIPFGSAVGMPQEWSKRLPSGGESLCSARGLPKRKRSPE